MQNITIIGLGHMGQAIADRLIDSYCKVTVYNRTPEKTEAYAKRGISVADTLQQACTDADIIISCLLDDKALTAVSEAILPFMTKNAIHISTATVLPATADEVATLHQQHNKRYISAAVLGVPHVARAGELTCFCAGKESDIDAATPTLQHFCRAVIPLSDKADQPLTMKVCMNYSLLTSIELMAELYCFAEKSGLDKDNVRHALHQIYGHPAFQLYADKLFERNFDDVNFKLTGGLKDVSLFQSAFEDAGVEPKMANIVKQRLDDAMDMGLENKDWSAWYEVVRKQSGLD